VSYDSKHKAEGKLDFVNNSEKVNVEEAQKKLASDSKTVIAVFTQRTKTKSACEKSNNRSRRHNRTNSRGSRKSRLNASRPKKKRQNSRENGRLLRRRLVSHRKKKIASESRKKRLM